MNPIIEIKGIWKSYQIGAEKERYLSLRDSFVSYLKNRSPKKNTFWALKDIGLNIYPGDTLGIIGKNGAGKTTLLKILSRISPPTKGSIKVRGRLASLLEVGTGFHPELTGQENIFLNGSILGLKRHEILRRYNEIVDFSEVGQFIETPLKHFSTGMQLRLAFAVAAHLMPEIIVIDEALSVGDLAFQKKCIAKMGEVAKSGHTLLFVSHNLSAIRNLCNKVIILEKGEIIERGNSYDVCNNYLSQNKYQELSFEWKLKNNPQFVLLRLLNESIDYNDPLLIETEIFSPFETNLALEVEIHDALGQTISYSSTAPMQGELFKIKPNQQNKLLIEISDLRLAAGAYSIYLWLIDPWKKVFDHTKKQALNFNVINSDPYKVGFDFKQSYGRGTVHHHLTIKPI